MLIQNASNATPQPAMTAGSGTPVAANPEVQMPPVTQVAAPLAAPSTAQLHSAIQHTNQSMSGKGLEFSVDATTKQTVVKLMDTKTGDMIGQFPSHQMLEISKAIVLMQDQLQQASLSKAPVQTAQGMLIKQQA
jgi:flagellar protein FlaG